MGALSGGPSVFSQYNLEASIFHPSLVIVLPLTQQVLLPHRPFIHHLFTSCPQITTLQWLEIPPVSDLLNVWCVLVAFFSSFNVNSAGRSISTL